MTFSVAPDEWECQVFIAVAETGGTAAAANRLKAIRGETYGRQTVVKTLAKIERWAGQTLLERDGNRRLYTTERGQEFLVAARKIVAQYRVMRGEAANSDLPRLACLPLHTIFVAKAEDRLYHEPPAETEKILVEYLPQDQRGEGQFHKAVEMLGNDVYQLIIGPPVKEVKKFQSTILYQAQLEAMVSVDHPESEMSLIDLVKKHRMLVPPADMRSRRLLEDAIQKWAADVDPGLDQRVAAESYETATSVMRLRHENSRGRVDKRVVVVPSDVAFPFKDGMEFGGRNADRFKWVPIYYRDSANARHLLQMDVCVTVRLGNRAKLAKIVGALQDAVAQLDQIPGHDGLGGAPLRRPVPRQDGAGGKARR
ncbi:LysR family transcriptional regulator [Phytohabitans houttuyneae]|uniref:LysR family transcriptional regulator n=1 Tax=Phytohabitans houttuyneae TaxID=1076126 RepID=UPI001564A0F5|nr:LysR family transcriptional regulator [Phytohabitans houttuyneae]